MKTNAKAIGLCAAVALALGLMACGGGATSPAKSGASLSNIGLPNDPNEGGRLGALSYAVPCYIAQGGASIVVGSGCTLDATSGTILGATTNDLNGQALVLDPGGSSSIQATADYQPVLTLGGTPTAAAFTVKGSQGTPVAVIRGGAGGIDLLGSPLKFGTSVPLAGVASTAIAPDGFLQPVSMATAGTVPITIPAAGHYVCIWNTGSEVVTIADTGNQILSASAALGQYDVLCGVSDGTRFIETSRSDN